MWFQEWLSTRACRRPCVLDMDGDADGGHYGEEGVCEADGGEEADGHKSGAV